MFQKAFSVSGPLAVAVAVVLMTASPSQAQGRSGGGHFGGYRGGGSVGGYHGGYYHGGYQHYNYHPYVGNHYYNNGYYSSHGHYPYYGYYPDYGSSVWTGTSSDPGYAVSGGDYPPAYVTAPGSDSAASGTVQSFYPSSGVTPGSALIQANTPAQISLRVPDNAQVWFDGVKTTSSGSVRQFRSPPLTPGQRYTYEVRARWLENGREVTQTQQVAVTAGASARADFPVPPGAGGQAVTTK